MFFSGFHIVEDSFESNKDKYMLNLLLFVFLYSKLLFWCTLINREAGWMDENEQDTFWECRCSLEKMYLSFVPTFEHWQEESVKK